MYQPRRCSGGSARGLVEPLDRGQLDRLIDCHVAGEPVADENLHRGGQAGDRERDGQRGALVTSPASAQPPERVGAGDQEAGDHVAGDVHVDQLRPQIGVAEQRAHRVDVDDVAARAGESPPDGSSTR